MKFMMRFFDIDGKKVMHEEEINLDSLIKLANPKDVGSLHIGTTFTHYDDEYRLRAEIKVMEKQNEHT